MDVSIIYVNYKTGKLIQDSIFSIKKNTKNVLYEIIVVDNNSLDGSIEEIEKKNPDILVLKSKVNVGFGRANNLGIACARGKMIFFLNPDTLLLNNAVDILYSYLNSSKNVGACGGNLLNVHQKPNLSFGRLFPSLFSELLSIFYLSPFFVHKRKSTFYNYTDKPMSVASIVGADLMVRKSLLDKIGGFSPDFFMNYEETELCYRIKKAGYKIMSVPDALIIHLEGASDYVSQSRSQLFYDGKYVYFKKIHGNIGVYLLYMIYLVKCNLRLFQFLILNRKDKIEYWKTLLQINLNSFLKVK